MKVIHKKGYYSSNQLPQINGCRHGFTARIHGNMRNNRVKSRFLDKVCGLSVTSFYCSQDHSADIKILTDSVKPRQASCDGLAYRYIDGFRPVLNVLTADCIGIILVEPYLKIAAVIHAGWLGTVKKIALNAVMVCMELGAKPGKLLAAFSPYIGRCCYTVSESRALEFVAAFSTDKYINRTKSQIFLDLGAVNRDLLVSSGLRPEHIDYQLLCTSCRNNEFFSYRKDNQTARMMSFVTFLN
ncbi:hypothetical protein A2154_01015 [Candidatus Gottesmanbacteria bacterium RBG_16_43_7]|uniref:Purine nucleoside phosphorylase n=1 Tax=Candidatus Gottesmanbacteria bacterium RBG_16_43_7 TaxID=1798373 RepID=A0A1F5Z855_9BACT|nr:MAG: hypothetical protein A2154_01015 [Candidatus Gottesmanbacteria bacterium RBG_16_43_7]